MDQVSLPMRIALLAVLAFAGVWLVALRPKPVAGPADAPPPVTAQPAKPAKDSGNGIVNAKDKATDAVAGANAKLETKAEAAGGETAAAKPAPATSAAKKPAATAQKTTPKPAAPAKADPAAKEQTAQVREIIAELDQGKVSVLLFWNRKGSDDREVRKQLAKVNLRGGKVDTHVASIDRLGDYEQLTRGVPVVTSPTLLVIDKNRRARIISGLTITREIDQLVGRALKAK